jgi:hypothetical protein
LGKSGAPEHESMAIQTQLVAAPARAISRPRVEIAIFTALLLAAAALRLMSVLAVSSMNWGDEIFQSIEQAHRLVYGTGLVPWEFQLGARSWILPGIIAGLMEAARLLGDGPDYYLPVIGAGFAVLAVAPVACCYGWCRRSFGVPAAAIGALFVVGAPELVYFGARTLMDVVAGHLLVIALYVIDPGKPIESRRRVFIGGLLLGLLLLLRIQLAPMLALLGVWLLWRLPRAQLAALIAGAALALLVIAIVDMATLGSPLASVWRYVAYNVFYGVSGTFGTEPWNFYLLGEHELWRGALGAMLGLALLGAWRYPRLLVYALAIVVTHSLIGHKEYRFIYPAIVLMSVLTGIGVAQLSVWACEWLRGKGVVPIVATALPALAILAYGALLMIEIWSGPTVTALRYRDHDQLEAAAFVRQEARLCGVGLYGDDGKDWVATGGYTYLHRSVPVYWPKDEAEFAATAPGFDTLIYIKTPPAASGFVLQQCFGSACVAQRPGHCASVPMMKMPFPTPVEQLAPAVPASAAAGLP